jgi:hypothetical protein
MENPIKSIVLFNKKAGLLESGYDDFLESSFQIEEALEGFNNCKFAEVFVELSKTSTAKDIARIIVATAIVGDTVMSDVDRLDKACDAVVFAVGSMAKLGLTAHQITAALNAVVKANNQKLSMPKDEYGKLIKPNSFIGPEPELQRILNQKSKI